MGVYCRKSWFHNGRKHWVYKGRHYSVPIKKKKQKVGFKNISNTSSMGFTSEEDINNFKHKIVFSTPEEDDRMIDKCHRFHAEMNDFGITDFND